MKRIIGVISLMTLLTCPYLLLAGCGQKGNPKEQLEITRNTTALVEVGRVERATLRHVLNLTGTLAPKRQVFVSSKVPGRISEIRCEEGGPVSQGEVLVRIDQTEYLAGMRQAKAAVHTAEAGLAKARAGTRPEQLRQIEAATAQAKANLDLAVISRKRMENLAKDDSIPRAKLDMVLAQEKLARGQHAAATAGLEMAKKGATKEDLAIVKAQVDWLTCRKSKWWLEFPKPGSGVFPKACGSRLMWTAIRTMHL
jgi:multidrug efflux pump subunit AcrA (membrane-fusion protein)